MKNYLVALGCLLSSIFSINGQSAEQAESIFKQLAPSLYQIRIIDKASGEKSSIGSGFQISADGLIATNYHVISGYARHPEKYDIELNDLNGNKAALSLESVDVINDLALVKRELTSPAPYFKLASSAPNKGEEIYSLGNPHDLGMIVVPGTYNGIKKESFNQRIHFTGSVNPGMSGGPVVNKHSLVVGINVATSGNQIGFLIPHDKLVNLYSAYQTQPPTDITAQITEQLIANQNKLINHMLSAPWQIKQLGQSLIPTVDVPYIRCWGESNADKSDALILAAVASCSLDEDTYISSSFFTSSIEMQFRYMHAKELSATKFYHLYEKQIARASADNKVGKDDVTEFECHHDIVSDNNNTLSQKAIFCTRAYKDFSSLYDVLFVGASVDQHQQALISHFTISGVQQQQAQAFLAKFMESVSWK